MRVSRAVPLALALAVMPLWQAAAQFGTAPGMPGAPMSPVPGMSPGAPGASFSAPQQPPPACQRLLSTRDDVAKAGQALQAAGQRQAPADEGCKLFKAFLAAARKMITRLQSPLAPRGVI